MQFVSLTPNGAVWRDDNDPLATLEKKKLVCDPKPLGVLRADSGVTAVIHAPVGLTNQDIAPEFLVIVTIGSMTRPIIAEGFHSLLYLIGLFGHSTVSQSD